jgi:hypothetical protein
LEQKTYVLFCIDAEDRKIYLGANKKDFLWAAFAKKPEPYSSVRIAAINHQSGSENVRGAGSGISLSKKS